MMTASSKRKLHSILLTCLLMTASNDAQTPVAAPVLRRTPSSLSNRTLAPSRIPIQTPEIMNTTAPSISAMPSMHSPTMKPISTNIAPPPVVSEVVDVTIDTLQITFSGVSAIAATDILQFEAIMDVWFEAYFNQEIESRQRYLLLDQDRDLEQFRVPDVRNMETDYTVVTQDTSTTRGSNIVSYTQMLSYVSTSLEPGKPQGYAVLPFADTSYKELLLKDLVTNIDSMIELSAISTPVIIPPNTMNDGGGLSTGAIVGVIVAAIFGLLLMAGVGYFIGKQKVEHASSIDTLNDKDKQSGEHRSAETIEPAKNTNTGQTPTMQSTFSNPSTVNAEKQLQHINVVNNEGRRQIDPPAQTSDHISAQTSDHVLNYKDQTRTVICPIVEAIPDSKKQTNDSSSMIPIASLVAL